MFKAILTIVFSIVGAIIGGRIAAGDSQIFGLFALFFVWVFTGIGGNLAIEVLDGFPFLNNSRDGSTTFFQALGVALVFLFIKSLAGPVFPIIRIVRYFRGE